MTLPPSPFKGLAYFGDSEHDWLLFFGRERETEVVAANLMASRLTVLYGPSGVGKSSLLRAGVARRLRTLVPAGPAQGEPTEVVIVDGWRDDPVLAVASAAGAATDISLADALAERVLATGAELFLILDQMEEYVLYHGRDGGPLAGALEDVLTRPDVGVHVLLGVRDDSLADLDSLKRRIPGLFGNVLRLDHLTRAAARSAIEGPLRAYAELGGPEVTAENELVETVLEEVAAGRIEQHVSGRGLVDEGRRERRVEAPYLQLVLERLWDVERQRGSDVLRAATLVELGRAEKIVEEHLERALANLDDDERDLVAKLFNHLVTPSGTKIAHDVDDLARYADDEVGVVEPLLAALDRARVLRRAPGRPEHARYEIFHDVLGSAVLAWRARHETERRLHRERAAATRRLRRLGAVAVGAVAAFALVAAIAVYALAQRSEARERARSAAARELTSAALLQLARDPELAVLLAREAVMREPTRSGEDALRRALIAFRGRSVTKVGAPVVAVAAARGEVLSIDRDGVLHAGSGSVRLAEGAQAAAFDPVARRVAVVGDDEVSVHGVDTGARLLSVALAPAGIRLALGDDLLVIAQLDGRVRAVALDSGAVVARFTVPRAPNTVAVAAGLVAVTNGHLVRVFDVERRRLVTSIVDRATLRGSAISPDGTRLVTGAADSAVRVWDLPSGRLVNVMLGHGNHVTSVAFTHDGTRVVTASLDGTARVWNVVDARSLGVLAGHTGVVTAVGMSSDDRLAVTGSTDGTARAWDALGDPQLRELATLDQAADDLIVGRERIVATSETTAVAVDLGSGRVARVTPPPSRSAFQLDGSEVRYRGPDGNEIVLRGHENTISSARYSRDRTRVVTASRDADARIWNTRDGALIHVLTGHSAAVDDASFSPDGRWVVTAGPITAGLFDAEAGESVLYLRGHQGTLTGAAFDPSGQWIVTAGSDATVRAYRCELCGGSTELLRLADRRLRAIGRVLTPAERRRYIR